MVEAEEEVPKYTSGMKWLLILMVLAVSVLATIACGRVGIDTNVEVTRSLSADDTSKHVPACIEKEVEVKLTKEGSPADVSDEVTGDVRAELIKSGVPSEVIEQVVKEVRTELVKEVVTQISTNETGRVEKTVTMEIVIGDTDKIGHASDCDTAHQD